MICESSRAESSISDWFVSTGWGNKREDCRATDEETSGIQRERKWWYRMSKYLTWLVFRSLGECQDRDAARNKIASPIRMPCSAPKISAPRPFSIIKARTCSTITRPIGLSGAQSMVSLQCITYTRRPSRAPRSFGGEWGLVWSVAMAKAGVGVRVRFGVDGVGVFFRFFRAGCDLDRGRETGAFVPVVGLLLPPRTLATSNARTSSSAERCSGLRCP